MSDGQRTSAIISKFAGVSDWTVRDYWKRWARIGIVEPVKVGGGERGTRSFDPTDFGIDVPKVKNVNPTATEVGD